MLDHGLFCELQRARFLIVGHKKVQDLRDCHYMGRRVPPVREMVFRCGGRVSGAIHRHNSLTHGGKAASVTTLAVAENPVNLIKSFRRVYSSTVQGECSAVVGAEAGHFGRVHGSFALNTSLLRSSMVPISLLSALKSCRGLRAIIAGGHKAITWPS